MNDLEQFSLEELEKAFFILEERLVLTDKEEITLIKIRKEINTRCVPKGELHLSVLSGEKKSIDFSLKV